MSHSPTPTEKAIQSIKEAAWIGVLLLALIYVQGWLR